MSTNDLVTAVENSLRAPSVHNTQPWRYRFRGNGVELHADRGRQLTGTDPEGRDLVLSCGAALHHLRVALAARGVGCTVAYTPDPDNRNHLATLTPTADPPDEIAAAFANSGVDPGAPFVATCGSGVTASSLIFAAHLLGNRDTRLYDGSWSEWGADPSTPKESAEA